MNYLQIRSWDKYQAYKDGRPMTWAKLYACLLDDYDFCENLTEVQQAHFIKLLCLAMKTGNKIPADPKWIAKKISAKSPVDLQTLEILGFIQQTINSEGERTESYEDVRNRTSSSLSLLDRNTKKEVRKNRAKQLDVESLPAEWRDYCAEKRRDLDPDTVFENFRDYYLSHGKPMVDWTRTWQRWVRNERQRAKPNGKVPPTKYNPADARPGESWEDFAKRMEQT